MGCKPSSSYVPTKARLGSIIPVDAFAFAGPDEPGNTPFGPEGEAVEANGMETVRVTSHSNHVTSERVVTMRCPACRKNGTFQKMGTDLSLGFPNRKPYVAGHRRCPDPGCYAHLFFILDSDGKLLATYPAETIGFDDTDLPDGVRGALKEAILCHANGAYVAAAIMVRKTLEELCQDRNAKGQFLWHRLQALRNEVILPPELFDGLEDVALLGNDAAHVESRHYDNVGKEEVEAALDFTKQVLQAVYQSSTLLARLQSLKKVK